MSAAISAFADPLIDALLDPPSTAALDAAQWNSVLWRARANGLLARLARELADRSMFDAAPKKARAQMRSALIAVESSHTAVRFEIDRVQRALADVGTPLLLLKGAAYLASDLPFARARLIGDVDLMVPRSKLADVERALLARGWHAGPISDYDDRYYRTRAHELPPMKHPQRDTPVDVHHTIAPPGSRARPDVDALWTASVATGDAGLRVLSPPDMVLHSVYHSFNDEVVHPLRDLFDVRDLLVHFGAQPRFWQALVERARLHGVGRPLHYALRYARAFVRTPVPAEVVAELAASAPPPPVGALMDRLFERRFSSYTVDGRRPRTIASGALYVRAHWLRMPPLPLARHLAVKAVARWRPAPAEG